MRARMIQIRLSDAEHAAIAAAAAAVGQTVSSWMRAAALRQAPQVLAAMAQLAHSPAAAPSDHQTIPATVAGEPDYEPSPEDLFGGDDE